MSSVLTPLYNYGYYILGASCIRRLKFLRVITRLLRNVTINPVTVAAITDPSRTPSTVPENAMDANMARVTNAISNPT